MRHGPRSCLRAERPARPIEIGGPARDRGSCSDSAAQAQAPSGGRRPGTAPAAAPQPPAPHPYEDRGGARRRARRAPPDLPSVAGRHVDQPEEAGAVRQSLDHLDRDDAVLARERDDGRRPSSRRSSAPRRRGGGAAPRVTPGPAASDRTRAAHRPGPLLVARTRVSGDVVGASDEMAVHPDDPQLGAQPQDRLRDDGVIGQRRQHRHVVEGGGTAAERPRGPGARLTTRTPSPQPARQPPGERSSPVVKESAGAQEIRPVREPPQVLRGERHRELRALAASRWPASRARGLPPRRDRPVPR